MYKHKRGLVLIVENNSNCGEFNKPEPLIEELCSCVVAWRKFFPEIPIFCICPSDKGLQDEIVKRLDVEYYCLNKKNDHQCGYYNIPLGLAWAEKNLSIEYMIHIDLDMQTLRPFVLPEVDDPVIYIGRLNDIEKKPFHLFEDVEFTFESNFICCRSDQGFFSEWQSRTEVIFQMMGSQNHEYYPEAEEFAIDHIYKDSERFKIVALTDYQVGSRYPLANIKDPMNVKFHHNHLYESKEEYIRWKLLTRL